jgi:hypothetical protein
MFENDYILRIFTEFFEELSSFLSKKGKVDAEKEIQTLYETYFLPSKYYVREDIETIYASFSKYNREEQYYRMQMLAELLYNDALIKEGKIKYDLLRKSLFLYERVDMQSTTFSFNIKMKIQNIKSILSTV